MKQRSHIADDELIQAIDGELSAGRFEELQQHLSHCWTCRVRRDELTRAIAEVVHMRRTDLASGVAAAEGPAARLRAQMAAVASQAPTCRRLAWPGPAALPAFAIAASVAALLWISSQNAAAGDMPDARLTPGATRSISKVQMCAAPAEEENHTVPSELAHRVFREYRIPRPRPRAYEVDYLITPALGGADDIRNLWPQPYAQGLWNARVKDALEDHLRSMVCSGDLDLATAQQEIASDWIAAYRKYFRTRRPLAAHALFVKDRPWE